MVVVVGHAGRLFVMTLTIIASNGRLEKYARGSTAFAQQSLFLLLSILSRLLPVLGLEEVSSQGT